MRFFFPGTTVHCLHKAYTSFAFLWFISCTSPLEIVWFDICSGESCTVCGKNSESYRKKVILSKFFHLIGAKLTLWFREIRFLSFSFSIHAKEITENSSAHRYIYLKGIEIKKNQSFQWNEVLRKLNKDHEASFCHSCSLKNEDHHGNVRKIHILVSKREID